MKLAKCLIGLILLFAVSSMFAATNVNENTYQKTHLEQCFIGGTVIDNVSTDVQNDYVYNIQAICYTNSIATSINNFDLQNHTIVKEFTNNSIQTRGYKQNKTIFPVATIATLPFFLMGWPVGADKKKTPATKFNILQILDGFYDKTNQTITIDGLLYKVADLEGLTPGIDHEKLKENIVDIVEGLGGTLNKSIDELKTIQETDTARLDKRVDGAEAKVQSVENEYSSIHESLKLAADIGVEHKELIKNLDNSLTALFEKYKSLEAVVSTQKTTIEDLEKRLKKVETKA